MTRAHGKPCASGFWLGAILFLYCFLPRPNAPKGRQIDSVLGKFTPQDLALVEPKLEVACEMIKSFACAGLEITMNTYNNK